MSSTFCTICGKHAELSCGRCMSSAYCSRECQKKDWALHSLLCEEYTQIHYHRPPDTDYSTYKLGLMLPSDSEDPRLVWVECDPPTDNPTISEEIGVAGYLPEGDVEIFRKYWRDHTVEMWMRKDRFYWVEARIREAGIAGPNQCLQKLMRGYETRDRACDMAYCSPVVIVSYTKEFEECSGRKYQDVTMADLRHALNFFARNVVMFEGEEENPFVVRYGTTWVKAAKISCDGDMAWMGEKKYRQVEIRRDYSIFEKHSELSQISKKMGIPLRVQKYGADNSWFEQQSKTFNPFLNRQVESMMLPVDNSIWHIKDSSGWQRDFAQTVLVARQDKKDLTAHQLEAFARYCQEFIEPAMLGPSGLGDHLDDEGRRYVAERYICREPFEDFFFEFKVAAQVHEDESWNYTLSPYEVEESKAEPAWDNKSYTSAPHDLFFDIERPVEVELDYG